MKKGGYKIIDLQSYGKKVDLSEDSVFGMVFDGTSGNIYEDIEGSYNKALLISGIIIDGVEKNDVFVSEYKVINANYQLSIYGYKLIIQDDNSIDISPEVLIMEDEDLTLDGTTIIVPTITYGQQTKIIGNIPVGPKDEIRFTMLDGKKYDNISVINNTTLSGFSLIVQSIEEGIMNDVTYGFTENTTITQLIITYDGGGIITITENNSF